MRLLPPLVSGPTRSLLPMADASAAALAGALLGDGLPADGLPAEGACASAEPLSALLLDDPPLVLWTVCVAAGRDNLRPRSLDEVLRWLAGNLLQVLQWEPDEHVRADAPEGSEAVAQAYGDRVAASVQVADLAARLAAQNGQPAAEFALLLGLLGQASDWLAPSPGNTAADPPDRQTATGLPDWLANREDLPQPAAAAWATVDRARAVLAGEASLPDSLEIDLNACRRRGAEARRRWLQPAEVPGGWLPVLAAKLARLEALENRFDELLETEKLEAMAEFAAGAGHEINNPLAVIAGRAQYFLREEEDPERRRALALMNAQAKRVYEMIADMMLFARPPRPQPEVIDVVELVDHLLEEFAPRAAQQEATLTRTGADGPVQLEVDPTQLTVALRAMCQNALEAIGREGRIEIGVQPAGPLGECQVEIQVSDDGPGISPEQRHHLFDPYYSARQAGRGLGLGLSKAWRIVTNHSGRIDVDSRADQGATFTITLPRHQPCPETES